MGVNAARLERTVLGSPTGERSVDLAAWRSALLAAGSLVLLVAGPGTAAGGTVPLLVAAAGVCLAFLTIRRSPGLAWIAAIGASYAASTLWFARARSAGPTDGDVGVWLALAAGASAWAIATLWIGRPLRDAPRTATGPGRGARRRCLSGVDRSSPALTSLGVVAAGQRAPDPAFNWIDVATVPISFFLPLLLVVAALGCRRRRPGGCPARRRSPDGRGRG